MNPIIPIEELAANVIAELERLRYSYNTICGFRAFYKRLIKFADENNQTCFSEDFGIQFLKEKYNCTINIYKDSMPRKLKNPIRKIRILGDYQLHGVIIRRIIKKPGYVCPIQFKNELSAYEIECQRRDYSKLGLITRMYRLHFFIDYLDARGKQNFNQITPELLSDYTKTIFSHHEKSISSILTTLRTFLKFLYLNEYTEKDLSLDVPKQKKYYYPPIPSVWNVEDVRRMLKCVDRGNPVGKRDYAILLLVARLGLRVSDIRALKLSNLNWNTKTIEITQIKTAHQVTYPILDDIGWAIIDYLKNGRPVTDSPYVFIRLCAPYESFGKNANLHNIITKYTRMAGIKIPKGAHHGMHSLRHTLASMLLEQGTPLPVISEILGHLNSKSTNIYLQTGIEGLRNCALDPEGVFKNEQQ